MEQGKKSVTGSVSAREADSATAPIDHMVMFGVALERALGKASRTFGVGRHPVTFEFHGRIDVTNPGLIGDYRVDISPRGQ